MSTAQAPKMNDRNQAIYRAIVQEAAQGGFALMGKMVSAARLVLQTREAASRDLRERDALESSARQLRVHESTLCKKYPELLLEAFAKPEGPQKAVALSVDDLHFDQLELMDEVQVLTGVALARTQQVAMLAAEASLTDLNTLICSLLGLGTVRPERNPLRPEMYVSALKATLEQTRAPASKQLDWMGAMGPTLAQELCGLYVALCSRLRGDGVTSASFAMLQKPLGVGQGRGVAQPALSSDTTGTNVEAPGPYYGGTSGDPRGGPVRGRDQTLLTLDKLRRLLSGELGGGPDGSAPANRMEHFAAQFSHQFESGPAPADVPSTDFDATVPAALEALTEMRQVDRVVQNLEQRRGNLPAPRNVSEVDGIRQALRSGVRDIAQALSLEVVTLMVDNMARDPRLLPPIQQLIRNMEPPLLRLALVDPRFFTDKQHVARQLLQEITHRSMAFSSVNADGFTAFLRKLEDTLQPLVMSDIASAEPFEQTLLVLQQSWGSESESKERERDAAVEILKHAEARNVLAEKIARGIDAHPDSKRVPVVVIDFLCGPWAQVVAQARIKGGSGSVSADKYQALIPALLWSAHPELARQQVSKLTRLVPRLLATLRDGLDTIRYPVTKTSVFFEALMVIHQLAFKATEETAVARDPAPVTERLHPLEEGNPWIAPEEAKSSNFMELPEVSADAAPVTAEPLQANAPVSPSGGPVDGDVTVGAWVEIKMQDQWIRTQLTWASPHGTLFLFTSAHGTTQSMTRRSRDRLIEQGRLRMISGQAVVEVALDAVAHAAMRNSVDTAL